jgi:hypothetical protein
MAPEKKPDFCAFRRGIAVMGVRLASPSPSALAKHSAAVSLPTVVAPPPQNC